MKIERQHIWAGGAVLLLAGGVIAWLCLRGYGELSPKSYDYAKALYSICNLKDDKRLAKVETMITDSAKNGEITERERGWLQDVIDRARDGDWETATARARRMMADQIGRK